MPDHDAIHRRLQLAPALCPAGRDKRGRVRVRDGRGYRQGDLINGTLTWVNVPRRREDGVWTPDLRGFIKADDGGELLVFIQGLSIDGD